MAHVRRLAHVRRQVRLTWRLPLAQFGDRQTSPDALAVLYRLSLPNDWSCHHDKAALAKAADLTEVADLSMLADLRMVADMSITIPCSPPVEPNITKQVSAR